MLSEITSTLDEKNRAASAEFGRILSAAVINKQFRSALLNDPSVALARGYCGEPFNLSSDLQKRISLMQSRSLEEFAAQLAQI